MQCPKCNARIAASSIYCNICGEKIKDEVPKKGKKKTEKEDIEKIDITPEVIDTYIGSGKEDLKKGNFSFLAFLLGPLYYYYRRLYTEATILLLIEVLIFFFGGTKYMALNLCVCLYAGFTFKRHYIKHVKEKVDEIIKYNISGKKENALLEAYNKGGTTTTPIVVVACLYLISIVGITFYCIFTDETLINNEDYENLESPTIETLTYEIPTGFIEDRRSTDTYKLYSTKDKYCNFYINENYLGGYDPKRNDYGKSSIEHLSTSEIEDEILINGYKWNYTADITKTSKTYNLTYKGDYIQYNISFFYIDDEAHAYCEESYEELKNSLELN